MRLMTYNILTGGVDHDDSTRLARVLAIVQEQQPDVLVLNECNHFDARGNQTLHAVERQLGMRGVLARAATGFHVAIFVRDLALVESEQVQPAYHAMLKVTALWGRQPVTILGAHLCPFGGTHRLLEAELMTRFALDAEWVFAAGDLNAISPNDASRIDTSGWPERRRARHEFQGTIDTRAIDTLQRAGLVDLALAADNPAPTIGMMQGTPESHRGRIDYVFGTRPVAATLRSSHVVSNDEARTASDHLPLVVDVEVPRSA